MYLLTPGLFWIVSCANRKFIMLSFNHVVTWVFEIQKSIVFGTQARSQT